MTMTEFGPLPGKSVPAAELNKLDGLTHDLMDRLNKQHLAVLAHSGYLPQDKAARMRYLVNAARAAELELFGYIVKLQEERMCDEDDA